MLYLILGLVFLVGLLFAMHGFASANPGKLARQLKLAAGVVALVAATVLIIRGMVGHALPLAMLGWWLLAGQGRAPWHGGQGSPQSNGQTSRVLTDTLEMELDHDSGAMRGRVLKGTFAGREIETLAPFELAELWHDCRFADPQSAQIVEAYLDRIHPGWREDASREGAAHEEPPRTEPGSGSMTIAEAQGVLGVEGNASEDEIRRAHRELMLKVHPDHGGSTYLAAKINEAKVVLLARRR